MWGFQGTICKKEKNFPIFTKYRWVHIPSVNLTISARNSSFPNLKNQNERGIESIEIRKRANSNRWIRSRRLCLGHKDMGHKVNINVSFHWQARWWACQNEIVWNAKFNERRELTNDNSSWQIVRLFAEHPALRSRDRSAHGKVENQFLFYELNCVTYSARSTVNGNNKSFSSPQQMQQKFVACQFLTILFPHFQNGITNYESNYSFGSFYQMCVHFNTWHKSIGSNVWIA